MKCHSLDLDTQSHRVSAQDIYIRRILTLAFTVVSKSKVILFGGATGDTGKYIITGDTYALDLICNKWAKLDGK